METLEISEAINYANIVPPVRDIQKMTYYKNKGSNPKRLVHDIRNNLDKIVSRYFLSIVMNWQEFAKEVERAQMAGELVSTFTDELMNSTAIQAANSNLEIPTNEDNSFVRAIKSVLNGEEIEDENELDKQLDAVTVPFDFKPKFTHVL